MQDFRRLVHSTEGDEEDESNNNAHYDDDEEDVNSNSDNVYMKTGNQWGETPWKGLHPSTPSNEENGLSQKKHPSSISDILDSSSSSKKQVKV